MPSTAHPSQLSTPRGLQETTTDFYVIDNLMRRIKRAQPLISIKIPNCDDSFVTALLDIDPVQRTLQFDELNPIDGHSILQQERLMHAHIRMEGQDIRFKIQLLDVGKKEGIAFYTCAYPESVLNPQRRAYYRAHIPYSMNVTLQLYANDSDTLLASGELTNISLGGIGAIIDKQLPQHFSGSQLEVVMHFPKLGQITTPIHACFIGETKQGTLLGAKFIYIDDRTENRIGNVVFKLQRDELRRIRRTEIGES